MDHTKKIESKSRRQSSFIKRRAGLFKKASELATLCDSPIAVIVYSDDGKLFEYATSSMEQIMLRFEKCRRLKPGILVKDNPEREVDDLGEEMEKLKQNNDHHVLGRDLKHMSRQDLQELEQQLNEGLLCIKNRKEALLVQKLQQSRKREQQYMQENETLRRKKVEKLERLCASISYQPPLQFQYQLVARSNFAPGRGVCGPKMACNTSTGDADFADKSLQLGHSTSKVYGKRKAPHKGRRDADTFLSL